MKINLNQSNFDNVHPQCSIHICDQSIESSSNSAYKLNNKINRKNHGFVLRMDKLASKFLLILIISFYCFFSICFSHVSSQESNYYYSNDEGYIVFGGKLLQNFF